MIKATLVVPKAYQKNRIFDMDNPVNGRDNHLYIFKELKSSLLIKGIDLSTQDINFIKYSEYIIFCDMPKKIYKKEKWQKVYLFAFESIAVLPRNFDRNLYKNFDKIFTWYDDIIDNNKVIKINYSFLLNPLEFIEYKDKTGFISMVCGNKYSNHSGELYSQRYNLINFFEKNTNYSFSLYGTNWNNCYKKIYYNIVKRMHKYLLTLYIFKIFEHFINISGLNRYFLIKIKNFKGPLSPKIPKLKNYKFNICYENTGNVNGYITEKIFDCFLSGCIPVYLGAPNIKKHIPEDTFIDRREFNSDIDLINFLENINEEKYLNYQNSIKLFLNSEKAIQFSSNYIAEKIISKFPIK